MLQLFNNTEMKRTSKTIVNMQRQQKNSDVDMDCSCEILNDTSLSNVGDSDCDCSQCLQANLNAFNQLRLQEDKVHNKTKQNNSKNRGQSASSKSNQLENKKTTNKLGQSTQNIQRNKSTDRFPSRNTNNRQKWGKGNQNQQRNDDYFGQFRQENQFSNGQLNDFLLITKHRTRKYLQQRKKMQQNNKKQKEQLKDKIKKNLQILKYTAQMVRDEQKIKNDKLNHPYKWNHQKYKCECNGKSNSGENKNCCRKRQRKYNGPSYQQILQQAKQKRKQKQQQKIQQKCIDHCPNHHNRTSQDKIQKIKQFIQKNVKKYKKQQQKKQKQQLDKQKTKQGKLKAIDIKSKQILSRSKKYNDTGSKSSFRLSIQQFDTFSEMRQQNQRRKKMKENERDIANKIKNGGGELLQKVYEDIDQNMDQFQLNINQKSKQTKNIVKQEMPQLRKDQKIYQRIAYDAQLKVPNNIKNKVKDNYKLKGNQQDYKKITQKKATNQDKKQSNLNRAKQQDQKRKIQEEIQRKKKQIMQQFRKRNSNKPDNSEMRKQYQQKLQNEKKTIKNKQYLEQQTKKDPYRSNYQTKPGKNTAQMKVHGDPLLQQYTYHEQKQKARQKNMSEKGDMDLFTENVHSLTAKNKFKS